MRAILPLLFVAVFAAAGSVAAPPQQAATKPAPSRQKADSLAADAAAKDTSAKKKQGVTDTVSYNADVIDYDMKGKVLHLTGNAQVKYQNITLFADTITYLIDNNLFLATGYPQLVEGGDTTIGESMVYNIRTRRGSVDYASTHMEGAYLNAHNIVKAKDNTFYSQNADYTTCARVDDPHFYFYAKDVKVLPSDKAVVRPAVLNIGDVPVGALPYFILPLSRGKSSGFLTPGFGGNFQSGGYLDNVGYYWALSDYADAALSSRITEFNDFVLAGSSNYALRYWLNGNVNARYSLGGAYGSRSQEWDLNYRHDQSLTPDGLLRLSGQGNLVSNTSFYKDVSLNTSEILRQTTDANMSLSDQIPSINGSLGLTWRRHQDLVTGAIDEDLPSLNFSLPGRPLIPQTPSLDIGATEPAEPAWYNQIYYSYNAHAEAKHSAQPQALVDKNYVHAGAENSASLSYSQKLFKVFDVHPFLNAHAYALDAYKDTFPSDTLYAIHHTYDTLRIHTFVPGSTGAIVDTIVTLDSLNAPETSYVAIDSTWHDSAFVYTPHRRWTGGYTWNTGVSLATTMYGLFPIKVFSFAGLRHTLTPSVTYQFTPSIPAQNRRYYPIGIAAATGPAHESQTIGFNLGNDFYGKTVSLPKTGEPKPVEHKFHIVSAGISTAYDFEAPARKWSDLGLSASTSNQFVNIGFGSAFWLYDQVGRLSPPILRLYNISVSPQINVAAAGTLWEGDRIAFDCPVPDDPVEYYNAGPQNWQMTLRPSYSFTASRAAPGDDFVSTKSYTLSASAGIGFTRRWSMTWNSYYNFVSNQLVGHTLTFRYDGECWDMRFDWSPSGVNTGFYFVVQVKKIPEIKWDKRP